MPMEVPSYTIHLQNGLLFQAKFKTLYYILQATAYIGNLMYTGPSVNHMLYMLAREAHLNVSLFSVYCLVDNGRTYSVIADQHIAIPSYVSYLRCSVNV